MGSYECPAFKGGALCRCLKHDDEVLAMTEGGDKIMGGRRHGIVDWRVLPRLVRTTQGT